MASEATTDASFPAFDNSALDMETSLEGEVESFVGAATSDQHMTGTAPAKPVTITTTTTHSSNKSTSTKQDAQMLPPSSFLYHRAYADEDSAKQLPDHGGAAAAAAGWGWGLGSATAAAGALEPGKDINHGRDNRGGNGERDVDAGDKTDGAENEHDETGNVPPPPPPFDLSAAMDEVGSFLLSWDTEREVREMEHEVGLKKVVESRQTGKMVEGGDGDVVAEGEERESQRGMWIE